MLETAILTIGGRRLQHVGLSMTRSAEQAARTAKFDLAWLSPGLPCQPDEEATVEIVGPGAKAELWLTGYVRDVNWSHDESDRRYSISLVSRTVDATESSIDHPTGSIEDCTLRDVAEAFDTTGIGVECDVETERKALHQINLGESLFDTIETDARSSGALVMDTPEGRLRITKGPDGRHSGALRHGTNTISSSGTLTGRHAFSDVKVRGQSSFGSTAAALRPAGEAAGSLQRRRSLIITHEGEATSQRLKDRAAWEAKRSAGKGTSASVTVPGWRDAAGKVFEANFLIEVVHPSGALQQDMVISAVTLEQDAVGGTTATLTLKDPRALGGENPRGQSADGWAAPEVPVPTFRATL